MRDLWPSSTEVKAIMDKVLKAELYKKITKKFLKVTQAGVRLTLPTHQLFSGQLILHILKDHLF